ncbi:MAG: hypothetical protein QOJ19_1277, partial [Acidimicrobiia bacterium]|nr:hypothetical protein [Acidimicrobiia bacterium]
MAGIGWHHGGAKLDAVHQRPGVPEAAQRIETPRQLRDPVRREAGISRCPHVLDQGRHGVDSPGGPVEDADPHGGILAGR